MMLGVDAYPWTFIGGGSYICLGFVARSFGFLFVVFLLFMGSVEVRSEVPLGVSMESVEVNSRESKRVG